MIGTSKKGAPSVWWELYADMTIFSWLFLHRSLFQRVVNGSVAFCQRMSKVLFWHVKIIQMLMWFLSRDFWVVFCFQMSVIVLKLQNWLSDPTRFGIRGFLLWTGCVNWFRRRCNTQNVVEIRIIWWKDAYWDLSKPSARSFKVQVTMQQNLSADFMYISKRSPKSFRHFMFDWECRLLLNIYCWVWDHMWKLRLKCCHDTIVKNLVLVLRLLSVH